MTPLPSRRKFLAGAATLGSVALQTGCAKSHRLTSATGTAFSTQCGVSLAVPKNLHADTLLEACFGEIARLESIFFLLDPASPLRRLNQTGELRDPPPELIEVLGISGRVHQLTQGAFDPTVQVLWELYETHFARHPTDLLGPSPESIAKVRKLVGWEKVEFDDRHIRLKEPGMKVTLNGVAPGYTADKVAELLSKNGVLHALIDCGEFRAIGPRPDGDPWKVAIRGRDEDRMVGHSLLNGNALATSAGHATAFDLEKRFHHLFSPSDSSFQPANRVVAVEAPSAALADALATAGGVMEWSRFSLLVENETAVTARLLGDS